MTAAGSFLVLSAPFLGVQYLGPDRVQNAHPYDVYVSDLFNFFVPTDITKLTPLPCRSLAVRLPPFHRQWL